MTRNTTVTSKGQITIPAEFRRRLGIKPGETVSFKLTDNSQVVMEKNDWEKGWADLHLKVAAHLKKHKIKPLSDEELNDLINQSAAEAAIKRYERSLK